MALSFHAVRSVPKAAKASISLVTSDAVDDASPVGDHDAVKAPLTAEDRVQ